MKLVFWSLVFMATVSRETLKPHLGRCHPFCFPFGSLVIVLPMLLMGDENVVIKLP